MQILRNCLSGKNYICTSDNNWGDPIYYGSATGNYMTNCISSDPTSSILVVNNNFPFLNPDGLGKQLGVYNPFQHTGNTAKDNSIIYAVSNPGCIRCGNNTNYTSEITEADYALLGEIADGSINTPNDDINDRVYTMQQQLYELLQAQPDIAANSPDLQQFISNNSFSSLDFINYTAQYLAHGDLATVNLLLGYWPGQTNVDDAYWQYYDWLKHIAEQPNWQPAAADVLTLANKCPLKHGIVVYLARNMYDEMTQKLNTYDDDCNMGMARGMRNDVKKTTKTNDLAISQFTMYPNPANNKISIAGSSRLATVEIIDMLGRVVLVKNSINSLAITIDNLKLNKGIYIVKTSFSNNTTATQKLIIE